MHPMFVKLYLENDADDVLAEEEDRRRAANRVRRVRSRRGHYPHRSRPGSPARPVRMLRARQHGRGRLPGSLPPLARFRSQLAGLRRTGPGRR